MPALHLVTPLPEAEAGSVEQRAAARLLVDKHAVLAGATLYARCKIKDVSATGARVQLFGRVELPLRMRLKVLVTGETAWARLVWRKHNMAGLRFETPLRAGPGSVSRN